MTEAEEALFLLTHTEDKTYYYDGKLRIHCWCKNGVEDGEHKTYYFNGILRTHRWYKDGEVVADFIKNPKLKKEYGINDERRKRDLYRTRIDIKVLYLGV